MAENDFITDISYTNKDFQSVYTEQLDLAKKLTDKWDPSMSNESDPGLILLKLNAMVADKCNYAIDKNILEAFPSSVTQDKNARRLFEQLGYAMRWYRSATTDVSISWIGDVVENAPYFKIPRFTMLCNDDGSVIYTLTEDCYLSSQGSLYSDFVSDKTLVTSVHAIEGVINEYQVNGSNIITLINLDDNNRIYLDTNTVAENGIFINNIRDDGTDIANYNDWYRVDNLGIEKLNSRAYKFGVDSNNQCYIEFPSDIDNLIGNGIRIKYVSSSGVSGNIKSNVLSKFYADIKDVSGVTLNSDNVRIVNGASAYNGYDPESIEEAYKNFKRVVGTFSTLVTLRDYQNAINASEMVSNCFVTDRTNDIQDSYNIVTENGNLRGKKLIVESDNNVPKIDAFGLKMYLLKWVDNVYDKNSYNRTFAMVDDLLPSTEVLSYIDDVKSIQHEFGTLESNKVLMFKNKYPVSVKIIPQYTLSEQQALEIENNVRQALYNTFNAKMVEFGDEVTYEDVYNVVSNCDGRIKAIVLDELDYKTYAVVHDPTEINPDNRFKEILVSGVDETETELSNKIRTDIYAKSVLNGNTELLRHDTAFEYGLNQVYTNMSSSATVDAPTLENVNKVDTEVNINIEFSEGQTTSADYTLRENEKITFYAPNLVDDISYGNYIKYEYSNIGKAPEFYIPANADYMLGVDEKICLYYKTSDDEDAQYEYVALENGVIVKPSFNLKKTATSVSAMVGASLHGNGTVPYNMQDSVDSIDTDLGASREIVTRKFNTVTINKRVNKCYWILNDKLSDVYGNYFELFTSSNRDRVLKSGEYFISVNETGTALEIFGQGTRLVLNGEWNGSRPWKVYEIDNSVKNIVSDGVNAFKDSDWFTFNGESQQLFVQEMQFFTLSEGDYVKFSPESGVTATDFVITSTPQTAVNLKDYIIEYRSQASSSSGVLPKMLIDSDEYSWQVISDLGLKLSADTPQVLLDNQQIIFHTVSSDGAEVGTYTLAGTVEGTKVVTNELMYQSGGTVSTEFIDSDGDKKYLTTYVYSNSTVEGTAIKFEGSACSISFVNDIPTEFSVDSTITEVRYELSGNDNNLPATGTSTLNLDSSKLLMIWKIGDYYYWDTFRRGSQIKNATGANIIDKEVSGIGAIPENGKTHKDTALGIMFSDDSITTKVADGKSITCSRTGYTNRIKFRVPSGDYIIPLRNSSSNMKTLSVSAVTWSDSGASGMSPIGLISDIYKSDKATDFSNRKMSYLYFNVPSDGNREAYHYIEFTLLKKPSLTPEDITISGMYKYTSTSDMFDDVLVHITGNDDVDGLDRGYYDYTFDVDDAQEIKNPLSADSFNDVNHIYNKFTICQMGSVDVKVINRARNI